MLPILDKLVSCCVPEENKRAVQQMIGSEKTPLYRAAPRQSPSCAACGNWDRAQQRQVLELDHQRLKGTETVRRTVEPVGILFSEYYFYLAAYLRGVDRKQSFENPEDPYPTIYRIDRIRAFCPTGEHFTPAYAKRFPGGRVSASVCSLCTAANCKKSGSNTPARRLSPCLTGSQPPKFSRRSLKCEEW